GRKPTATARGSSANVCHNAPTMPGIYRANPRSAPPPTASACDPSSGRMACSPRRYGGCAACDPPWSPPAARLGCHSPCPGPDPLHHAVVAPALEPAVDGAVRAELLGQAVPLAATAEAVDDAIEHGPPIPGRLSALGAGLPILPEDWFNASPEVVRNLPDGI